MTANAAAVAAAPKDRPGGAVRRLFRNRASLAGAAMLALILVAVVAGPMLSPHAYDHADFSRVAEPPSVSDAHYFGTDAVGRDLFARTLVGGRISLLVGLVSSLVSVLIGVSWGAVAGYAGGRVDAAMMRVVDILYALPFMFFVILLMVVFGRHLVLIFAAIGAISWLDMARIVRGQTLSLRRREFVEAAEAFGVSRSGIIRRHIVPNVMGMVMVYATLTVPRVILVESFLSFLGLGVQEPLTSWGALVAEGAQSLESAPWMLIFPATLLGTTVLSLNFLGDGLRDALDPKDR